MEEERWIEAESLRNDDELDSHEDMYEMFADPDPHDTFNFDWEVSNSRVSIHLSGYKAELGQTLHSTGLTLWRASELLCDFIVSNTSFVERKRVLELGAGLGLCGILAHKLKATCVLLTDGDTDTLSNLRKNVERNCSNNDNNMPLCHQLVWGRNVNEHLDMFGQYDTIIGADIIYVEEVLDPLWSTVSTLLTQDGVFLLAYARRNVKFDLVSETASKYCFQCLSPKEAEGVFIFKRSGES